MIFKFSMVIISIVFFTSCKQPQNTQSDGSSQGLSVDSTREEPTGITCKSGDSNLPVGTYDLDTVCTESKVMKYVSGPDMELYCYLQSRRQRDDKIDPPQYLPGSEVEGLSCIANLNGLGKARWVDSSVARTGLCYVEGIPHDSKYFHGFQPSDSPVKCHDPVKSCWYDGGDISIGAERYGSICTEGSLKFTSGPEMEKYCYLQMPKQKFANGTPIRYLAGAKAEGLTCVEDFNGTGMAQWVNSSLAK